LKRIINASSNPGDLVLDCYCGSGTTLAAAAHLGRRWIGVDQSPEAIRTTLRRFVLGTEPMGDFVSQRRDRPDKPARGKTSQQSLFDAIKDDRAPAPADRAQPPVLDFVLLTETGLADAISVIVQDWERQFNGNGSLTSSKGKHIP
jgi:SAM-dependent methyltransferase